MKKPYESDNSNLDIFILTNAKKTVKLNAKQNIHHFKNLSLLRQSLPESKKEFDKLRDMLIRSNSAFVSKYVLIYSKLLYDHDIISDLYQEAQLGLIEAVDKFDPYRDCNFTTYAFYTIRKFIIDYIKTNKVVSINKSISRYIKHISEVQDKVYTKKGFMPRVEEIQEILEVERNIKTSTATISTLLNHIDLTTCSEKSFITDDMENISYDDEIEYMFSVQHSIKQALKDLDPNIRDIILMRFGIGYDRPYSMEEIKFLKNLSNNDINNILAITNSFQF